MIFLIDPDTAIDVPFDWSDSLGAGITLSSAVHTVPTGLTKGTEVVDTVNGLSKVRVTVTANAPPQLYIVEAKGTLSSGEVIVKRGPVRVMAG